MTTASTARSRQTTAAARIGRQSLIGIAVRFSGIGLSYLTLVVLTRQLGVEQYGAFCALLSLSTLMGAVFTAGSDRLATRTISALNDTSRIELIREVVLAHAVALIGTGIGLAMLAAAYVFGGRVMDVGYIGPIASLAMVVFPVMVLVSLRQWIALPLHGAAASIVPEQLVLPATLLSLIGVAHWTGIPVDFSTVAVLYAISGLFAWCVGVRFSAVHLLLQDGMKSPVAARDVIARVRSGMPFLSATISTVMMSRSVPLIVAGICGLGATGKLSVAVQLAAIAAVPLMIVNLAIVPRCVRHHTAHEHEALASTVRIACTLCVGLTLPLGIVIVMFAESAVGLLDKDFSGSEVLLSILVVGQCINACCGPNGSILQMVGREKLYSSTLLMTNSAQVVVVLLAAWTGNIEAVAIGIVMVESVRNVLLSVLLWKKERLLMLPTVNLSWSDASVAAESDRDIVPRSLDRAA